MNGFSCFRCSTIGKPILGLSNRRFSIPKPLFSTRQLKGFESTDIPGKLVAGRLNPPPPSRPMPNKGTVIRGGFNPGFLFKS